jgi:HTH-type transcriptional regulator/antitoxin HipB
MSIRDNLRLCLSEIYCNDCIEDARRESDRQYRCSTGRNPVVRASGQGADASRAAARIGVGQSRLSSLETIRTESLSLKQLLELTALYGLELSIRTKDGRDAADVEW